MLLPFKVGACQANLLDVFFDALDLCAIGIELLKALGIQLAGTWWTEHEIDRHRQMCKRLESLVLGKNESGGGFSFVADQYDGPAGVEIYRIGSCVGINEGAIQIKQGGTSPFADLRSVNRQCQQNDNHAGWKNSSHAHFSNSHDSSPTDSLRLLVWKCQITITFLVFPPHAVVENVPRQALDCGRFVASVH
jgi:hypothetical protein